ncbi:MAG: hypothetical protein J6T55_04085 [Alphaproteobacteria bacterium]|nr:hypothetical protein [Alphaproteobacteria bacterium]
MTLISDFQQKARQLIPEQKEFLIRKIKRISEEQERVQKNKETLQRLGKEIPKNFGSAVLKEPMENFVVTAYLLLDSPDREKYTSEWGGGLASASSMLSWKLGQTREISRLMDCDFFTAVGYFLYQNCSGLDQISETEKSMPPEKVNEYMTVIKDYANLFPQEQEKFIQDIQEPIAKKICSHTKNSHKISCEKTR